MNTTLTITRSIAKLALVIFVLMQLSCGGATTATTTVVSASAGDDSDVLVGTEVTLNGGASTGVTTVEWTLTSTPAGSAAALATSNQVESTFTPDVVGDYVAEISVNDGESTDEVTITARNIVADISVPSGSAVTVGTRFGVTTNFVDLEETGAVLTAASSDLAEGVTIATYEWEQISGPTATITSADSASSTLEFTAPSLVEFQTDADLYKWQILPVSRNDRKMMFRLTVTDSNGNSDIAVAEVYINDAGDEIHTSSGLPNVGLNSKIYLSGPSEYYNSATDVRADQAVTDWSWTLAAPEGSAAVFLDSNGASSTVQFPVFVPDVEGVYTVTYSSVTGAVTDEELSISVSEYSGVGTVGGTTPQSPQCANCHDGTVEDDVYTGYSATQHASVFSNNISSYASLAPEPYLWEYHTVGYNTDADSSGFDDMAAEEAFEFPADGLLFDEFAAEYPDTAKLANVQCESCHGPGSEHNGSPQRISFSVSQYGVCGQCHIQEAQLVNGGHQLIESSDETSWKGASCNRCHTGDGFRQMVDAMNAGDDEADAIAGLSTVTEEGAFQGIQCAGCHDPHDATNPAQLRRYGEITMVVDGSTVDAGKSANCYTCHDAAYKYGLVSCDDNNDGTAEAICTGLDQMATGLSRVVHYNPQAPVLEGKGALTDLDADGDGDFDLDENSFHTSDNFILSEVTGDSTLSSTNDKCVTCHMFNGPTSEEDGYNHLGGHSVKMATEEGLDFVQPCQQCHLDVEDDFNRTARADYDGDGEREGIEDEITGLLYAVTTKIIANDGGDVITTTSGTTLASGAYTVATLSYTSTSSSTKGWRIASDLIRRAVWNYNLIVRDGSLGIHNAAFAIQVLQGTYSAVGGNSFATDYPNATIR